MRYKINDRYMITRVIKEYPKLHQEINRIKDDIIYSRGKATDRHSPTSDPTSYKAMAIMSDKRIIELERELSAVDAGIAYIKTRHDASNALMLLDLLYWKRKYNFDGAIDKIGFSKRHGEEIIKHFRFIVAQQLGNVTIVSQSEGSQGG